MDSAGRAVVFLQAPMEAKLRSIKSGMTMVDLERDNAALKERVEHLQRALCAKQERIHVLEAAVREQRRVDVEARAQYMREREALRGARGARRAKAVGLLALGVMAGAAVVSMAAMRIIGGMA